jgi:uncharacterized protein (DUF433 family)
MIRSTKIPPTIPDCTDELHELAVRWRHAIQLLRASIDTDPKLRSGLPCIKGTRITASQVLAQLAEGDSISEIADDMSIDQEMLKSFLDALSIILDRPHE